MPEQIDIEQQGKGELYVVATPIGNLGDITLRAIDILGKVDAILCEDTRVARKLLGSVSINRPLISVHQHTADIKIEGLLQQLNQGVKYALITDSGTPGISDPGARLIRQAQKYDRIKIIPVPGASALTAALSVSGSKSKNIVFFGFLPHKKGRKKLFGLIENDLKLGRCIVLYESRYRLYKTIASLQKMKIPANIVIARELTKKFEQLIYCNLADLDVRKIKDRGEFTIVIYP